MEYQDDFRIAHGARNKSGLTQSVRQVGTVLPHAVERIAAWSVPLLGRTIAEEVVLEDADTVGREGTTDLAHSRAIVGQIVEHVAAEHEVEERRPEREALQ